MSEENFVRHRFSVPKADESVTEWIAHQSNLSFSIRFLIKDYIRVHGMTDATCAPVEQRGKVGRPSNAELAAREVAKSFESSAVSTESRSQIDSEPVKSIGEEPLRQNIAPQVDYQTMKQTQVPFHSQPVQPVAVTQSLEQVNASYPNTAPQSFNANVGVGNTADALASMLQ